MAKSKPKPVVKIYEGTKLRNWINDAKDPQHEDHVFHQYRAEILVQAEKMEKAEREADKFMSALVRDMSEMENYPALSSAAVIFLLTKIDEESQTKARQIIASLGGKASKKGSLQKLIEKIVKKNSAITEKQLLDQLRAEIGQGLITDITQGQIEWCKPNGQIVDTPVTALKDRLTRAKKSASRIANSH